MNVQSLSGVMGGSVLYTATIAVIPSAAFDYQGVAILLGAVTVFITGIVTSVLTVLTFKRQNELAERNAINSSTTLAKLGVIDEGQKVIHTLVNSNLTAAMQAELESSRRELAITVEVIDLKEVAGRKPTPEVLAALAVTKARVSELAIALADRVKQQKIIDDAAQAKTFH